MRASELIEQLEELIRINGDCYVVYYEEGENGMANAETLEVVPHYETKYFLIG